MGCFRAKDAQRLRVLLNNLFDLQSSSPRQTTCPAIGVPVKLQSLKPECMCGLLSCKDPLNQINARKLQPAGNQCVSFSLRSTYTSFETEATLSRKDVARNEDYVSHSEFARAKFLLINTRGHSSTKPGSRLASSSARVRLFSLRVPGRLSCVFYACCWSLCARAPARRLRPFAFSRFLFHRRCAPVLTPFA